MLSLPEWAIMPLVLPMGSELLVSLCVALDLVTEIQAFGITGYGVAPSYASSIDHFPRPIVKDRVLNQRKDNKVTAGWDRPEIRGVEMLPEDHNKTLVLLHSGLGAFFTSGLLAAPWIVAKNFRHGTGVPTAILLFGIVLFFAALFWSTAISMYRRKTFGRKLALVAAVAALPIIWPVGVYTWWFMHSEAARKMYR
jgi:hypothetical protein